GRRQREGPGGRHQRGRQYHPPGRGAGHGGGAHRRPRAHHLHHAVEQVVKFWTRRGAIAWLLWPVSLVFSLVVIARRFLYAIRVLPSRHPGIPVIVVGNVTVGGTGKTPLVIWIAEFLKKSGWSPAIVSRGYGGKSEEPRAATIASEASDVGDE